MKNYIRRTTDRYAAGIALLILGLAATSGRLTAQDHTRAHQESDEIDSEDPVRVLTLETTMGSWSGAPRAIARTMIEKYGDPDRVSLEEVIWHENKPWLETEVFGEPSTNRLSSPDTDYLKQTIHYLVPKEMVAAIKLFDRRIDVDSETAELSSQSESESMNYLAINLVDEIVRGQRSVAGARAFYMKTARLAQSGKQSPYLDRFLFKTDAINTAY